MSSLTQNSRFAKIIKTGCSSAQMDKEMKDGQPLLSPPTIQKMDRGASEDGTLDEDDQKDAWWAKDKV